MSAEPVGTPVGTAVPVPATAVVADPVLLIGVGSGCAAVTVAVFVTFRPASVACGVTVICTVTDAPAFITPIVQVTVCPFRAQVPCDAVAVAGPAFVSDMSVAAVGCAVGVAVPVPWITVEAVPVLLSGIGSGSEAKTVAVLMTVRPVSEACGVVVIAIVFVAPTAIAPM